MAKSRRPTIPLSDWRIATDLKATAKIQGQHGTPAYCCNCDECSRWRSSWASLLPEALSRQLVRLGVDPGQPTDIYGGERPRVSFHVVGKILSGPDAFRSDEQWGRQQVYRAERQEPWLGISVARSLETTAAYSVVDKDRTGDLIVIDLRLDYPESA